MNPNYQEIGKRLKSARSLCGLTQQDVADFTQLSVSYVKNTERGIKPSLEYLFKVSHLCRVTVGWLLTGDAMDNSIKSNTASSIHKVAEETESYIHHNPVIQEAIEILNKLPMETQIFAVGLLRAAAEHSFPSSSEAATKENPPQLGEDDNLKCRFKDIL